MSEWKKLKIDNLPSDILTGDYEFTDSGFIFKNDEIEHMTALFENLIHQYTSPKYRKPEPLPPTHEEIMTKWWKYEEDWIKVFNYNLEGDQKPYGVLMAIEGFQAHEIYRSWLDKEWFTNRESATIPPEVL